MRLLDNTHGIPSRNVALYLTRTEAESLKAKLGWLLAHSGEHFHLEDSTGREVSMSIFEEALLKDPATMARYNKAERDMFGEP